ncbi:hypothetical protein BN946_scf184803.g28 [Trametes cinnabarina]|uniref:F-box domain-containing protein n=1 Tax=Pycnoporus cinnabarinus TaxID=5643 RepID=A0A060S676_PYCCI|nr:hypothetical protein BN946_scf184803.g28 [Trametes cinnabarina]
MSSETSPSLFDLWWATLQAAFDDACQEDIPPQGVHDVMATDIVRQLRYRANALAPVNRLPAELLVFIFEHATDTRSGHRQRPTVRARIHSLLDVSHVCKQWRDVALDAPALWTCVDDRNEQLLKAFFEHSRSLPISLHLSNASASKSLAGNVSLGASRLKRLDITMSSESLKEVYPLWSHWWDLRNLECLTVVSDLEPHDTYRHMFPMFSREYCCNLLALSITSKAWFLGNHFPQLTHLYLSLEYVWLDTLQHLIQLLSHTPALQYLHVKDLGLNGYFNEFTDVPKTIPLRALRVFTCTHGYMPYALLLLSLMEFPENVLVRLDHQHDKRPIFQPPERIQQIPFQAWLSSLTRLEVSSLCDKIHIITEGSHSGLWIERYADGSDGPWTAELAELCTSIPLPSVTYCQVCGDEEGDVPAVLRQLPLVTDLAVMYTPLCDDRDLLEVLARAAYTALAADALCCPELKTLRVGLPRYIPELFALPSLIDMIKIRADKGRPLHRLIIDPGESSTEYGDLKTALQPAVKYITAGEVEVGTGLSRGHDFGADGTWNMPEVERWWDLHQDEKAVHRFPDDACYDNVYVDY